MGSAQPGVRWVALRVLALGGAAPRRALPDRGRDAPAAAKARGTGVSGRVGRALPAGRRGPDWSAALREKDNRLRATFVNVPIGGLITDEEMALDLGAIGRPGPLHDWSVLSNDREEDGAATTRTIRLVHPAAQH